MFITPFFYPLLGSIFLGLGFGVMLFVDAVLLFFVGCFHYCVLMIISKSRSDLKRRSTLLGLLLGSIMCAPFWCFGNFLTGLALLATGVVSGCLMGLILHANGGQTGGGYGPRVDE